jgi:hypothetical protein
MKTTPIQTPPGPPRPAPSYAELLAALDARRRSADDILLRKMIQPREPMNPG